MLAFTHFCPTAAERPGVEPERAGGGAEAASSVTHRVYFLFICRMATWTPLSFSIISPSSHQFVLYFSETTVAGDCLFWYDQMFTRWWLESN